MSLCLVAGALTVSLLAPNATLAWTHSVEKIVWEEDWRATPAGVELVAARVRGSGAGMDPPAEARFVDGSWTWRPQVPAQQRIVLRRSGATADWRVCVSGKCQPMEAYLPPDADPVVLTICPR